MTAAKRRNGKTEVNKNNYHVDKRHNITVIGNGRYAPFLIKELFLNKVNVCTFLTSAPVKEKLEGIVVKRFDENRKLAQYMHKASKEGSDFFLSAFYGKRIPNSIIGQHGSNLMNLHASLLPFYRGPNPVEDMLEEGVEIGGVTLHNLNYSFDTGDVLAQRKFGLRQCIEDNYDNAVTVGAKLFAYIIKNFKKITPKSQKKIYEKAFSKVPEASDFNLKWKLHS